MRLRVASIVRSAILASSVGLLVGASGDSRTVAADETVIVFPTAAHRSPDGQSWLVPIHAWVFEPETGSLGRAALIDVFASAMGLDEPTARSPLFRERAAAFLVENKEHKQLAVTVADASWRLTASSENGHIEETTTVSAQQVEALKKDGKLTSGWLPIVVHAGGEDPRTFVGAAQLVAPEGISVISDIDDTIKVCNVKDRHELLLNSLVRPYRAIDGMSAAFRSWADRGATFHYVTATPWQLHEALTTWMAHEGFPRGALSMKAFRWKDSSFFNLFAAPETTKTPLIESLFGAYPSRRFVLVGDSGENDAEIYGNIARAHPKQVARIYIRNITNEGPTHERWRTAFKDVPTDLWTIFEDPAALAPSAAMPGGTQR